MHRDIKPQNMLLSAPIDDPSAVAKIADFGAAVFTCGIGRDKVSYGGTPHFQVREEEEGGEGKGKGRGLHLTGCVVDRRQSSS